MQGKTCNCRIWIVRSVVFLAIVFSLIWWIKIPDSLFDWITLRFIVFFVFLLLAITIFIIIPAVFKGGLKYDSNAFRWLISFIALIVALSSIRFVFKIKYLRFQPIIHAYADFSCNSDTTCEVVFVNLGHGVARNVTVKLTGVESKYTKNFIPCSCDSNVEHLFRFSLKNTDLHTKLLTNVKLRIEYNDAFAHLFKTVYEVDQKTWGGDTAKFRPVLDFSSFATKRIYERSITE